MANPPAETKHAGPTSPGKQTHAAFPEWKLQPGSDFRGYLRVQRHLKQEFLPSGGAERAGVEEGLPF